MDFAAMINGTASWLDSDENQSNVVVSCRIRLARNIINLPFPHWAELGELEEVFEQVKGAFEKLDIKKNLEIIKIHELSAIDRQILVERHLVSKEHTENEGYPAVTLSQDEQVSFMINEEDHLRLQVFYPGFKLMRAWEMMDSIDDQLSSLLEYAYHNHYGYLTSCPTNVGTGLRASVMLHLPALVMRKQIDQVLRAVSKLGLAVRGWYGEGSEVSGNLFQISNQVTLGQKEKDIILNLEQVIRQIIEHEKSARQHLLKNNSIEVEDKVGRAYGLMKHARSISSIETLDHLSAIRTGIEMGLVDSINVKVINELFLLTQPAHIQKIAGKKLSDQERDIKRAKLIRKMLREEKFD